MPGKIINSYEEMLQALPEGIAEKAKELGAFRRARKVKDVGELLRIILMYCGMDLSLRETSGQFTLTKRSITDTSVKERLENCGEWLKWILKEVMKSQNKMQAEMRRLLVLDGTGIHGPGSTGTQYRLHTAINLETMEISEASLGNASIGESLDRFKLKKGDIAIEDRGYAHTEAMINARRKGADLVIRINPQNIRLYHPNGDAMDIQKELHKNREKNCCIPTYLKSSKSTKRLKGFIHAYRLPQEKLEIARRKCYIKNSKKGREPRALTLYFSGWVFIFSTLSPNHFDSQSISELYRLRWQIELVFKRAKSLLGADQLRAKYLNPLAEVWVVGKLLYLFLVDHFSRTIFGHHWCSLKQTRQETRSGTQWRIWSLISSKLNALIQDFSSWNKARIKDSIKVILERKRSRTLQTFSPNLATALGRSL